jgi:TonB family protein
MVKVEKKTGLNVVALAASVLVHAALVLAMSAYSFSAPRSGEKKDPVFVDVVELPPLAPGQETQEPDEARYYSDRSQKVETETVTDRAVPEPIPGTLRPSAAAPAPEVDKEKIARLIEVPTAPAPPAAPAKPTTKTEPVKDEAPDDSPEDSDEGTVVLDVPTPAAVSPLTSEPLLTPVPGTVLLPPTGPDEGGEGEGAGDLRLFPTEERLRELAKQYSEEEPEREKGKVLSLNTSELKYSSYLLTMKRRIEFFWNYPYASIRNNEQGRLRINFTISSDGSIEDVEVVRSSNYPALDDAAVTAIRLAAPFNPLPEDFGTEAIEIRASFEYLIVNAGRGQRPGRRR